MIRMWLGTCHTPLCDPESECTRPMSSRLLIQQSSPQPAKKVNLNDESCSVSDPLPEYAVIESGFFGMLSVL
jgi:hypothetical protein